MPKGQYDRAASAWTPKPKRVYDPKLVDRVVGMYQSGMTIAEIQAQVPGVKVQRLLERHLSKRRSTAKRNQRGPANHMWRGDAATYKALHLRVRSERGAPAVCDNCGATPPNVKLEWANRTGNYTDMSDYDPLCVPCHRTFDAARRALTGRRTMPVGR